MSLTLPLSDVVDVSVFVSPIGAAVPNFNQGLIVGTSNTIPSSGANARVRQYSGVAGMAADGFAPTDPEYLAAQEYFGASGTNYPAPQYIWIGRQDLTALQTVTLSATLGSGYTNGDIVTVVQGGASGGQVKLTVAGNTVTAAAVVAGSQGRGYAIASSLTTTGGTGTGLELNITAIGETPLQALTACRLASPTWWGCTALAATDSDHTAIAPFIEAAQPPAYYWIFGSDAAIYTDPSGSIINTLQEAKYSRSATLCATTQGGTQPNNAYSAAAALGVMMGLNTGLAGSDATLKFKSLTGIVPEPLTQSQVTAIEALNGNVYAGYDNGAYAWIEQGVSANGEDSFDILQLDMLRADIQVSLVDVLASLPKVPQDDAGQTLLIQAVIGACERAATRGFIGPGTWTGPQVLNLKTGTALPSGYTVQSDTYSNQSQADRNAGKSMPIYVSIIRSGAVKSITIGVYVQ